MVKKGFKTTEEIVVPKRLADQIVGQDKAVEIIKKAAKQKRHVLLIGPPGCGKSLLAQAMAELLPVEKLEDVLSTPNPADPNNPKMLVVPAGEGKKKIEEERKKASELAINDLRPNFGSFFFISILFAISIAVAIHFQLFSDVIIAAFIIIGGLFMGLLVFAGAFAAGMKQFRFGPKDGELSPKLLIDNSKRSTAPFIEATGAHSGALFGDVLHDPLQCIPGNELVHLPNGKPIEVASIADKFFENGETGEVELKPEQQFELLTGSDENYCFTKTKVSKVFKREIEEDIVELETRKGYVIKVTKNHPIAVFNEEDGSIKYAEASAIQEGNYTIVPKKLPIYAKKPLSESLLLFIADALADGHFAERSVIFKVRTDFKEKQFVSDIERAGFEPHVIKRGKDTEIYLNSAAFVRELKSLGVLSEKGKTIPDAIFDQDTDSIKKFLMRYLSLDGYVNKQGQFELLSKEMIPEFICLFLKLGIQVKYVPRKDTGFGKLKGTIQPRIRFNDYYFAKDYRSQTINPIHIRNLDEYLSKTSKSHVRYDDIIPISFDFIEPVRKLTGFSKTKVHDAYYALNQTVNTSKLPTRQFLCAVRRVLAQHTNCPALSKLGRITEGTYAYDEIIGVKKKNYNGFVYNFTTNEGTFLVNNILTHNSGGLGTPPHIRVQAGMIHRANKGVLFIDEVAALSPKSQQELLTAMQEKKYPITGQSEMSSGAMVRTEPVPCDFILVASGNIFDIEKMHPALRSRIRGYGYEVYLNEYLDENEKNKHMLEQFVAQEVVKDGKISHFAKEAVEEIITDARKRASRKKKYTMRLRDLGGLIRAAGDIAKTKGHRLTMRSDVLEAKGVSQTLEQQVAEKQIIMKKEYEVIKTTGFVRGRVNGLAVMGDGTGQMGGLLLPIEAEVAPAQSTQEGKIIATGKLGDIAKEAVQNVSAIIKKYKGANISNFDIHIQFLQTYEGVEGDSASISVATAVLSALEGIPVDQRIAMTGSLSVKGEVLPVGGVTAKVEAAIEAGAKTIIIPDANKKDIVLAPELLRKVKIVPVDDICGVLKAALKDTAKKKELISQIKKIIKS